MAIDQSPRRALVTHAPRITALLIAGIVAYNIVQNLLLPSWAYVLVNVAAAVGLLAGALKLGLTRRDLGTVRSRQLRGAAVGAALVAAIAIAILAATATPWGEALLQDGRVAGVSTVGALYQITLRIPLGTALFEEVLFRGVLLGWLLRRTSEARAMVASSALFGLWHILPTWQALDLYQDGAIRTSGGAAVAVAVLGGVVVTAVVGLLFSWLRLRTDSLAAPIVLHAGVNSLAYAAVFVVAGTV